MSRRFRKKPVVIEALQYTGKNSEEVITWVGWKTAFVDRAGDVVIVTLEGNMQAAPGWWIIRGVQGEFYPCQHDIFQATYEPVEDES